jgi:TonB family protein
MIPLLALLWAPLAGATEPPAPSPTADADPLPLTVQPELLQFVQAPYPEAARAAGREGTVKLLITIDALGLVTEVELIAPAGEGFDEAALEAARQFRFRPAEDATGPVPVAIEFDYGFVADARGHVDAVPEAPLPPVAELPVNLEGSLIEMGTRAPVDGAPVHVVSKGTAVCDTATDAKGRWACRGVPEGTVTVTAATIGYVEETRTVEILVGQVTDLRLWIRNANYHANEIVGLYRKPEADITRRTLSMDEVRRIPGTFGDPVRVIQNLPGAARAPLGTGLLVIRGANPEDSAVYVDGIRIPLIYHLGGYSSVFNADLVEAVDYLPGGYGVQYGRSMGGVVDVRSKTTFPERNRVVWNTDALDTGVLVEGRVGKDKGWGLAVAGRRSYIDAIIPYFVPDPEFVVKPRWYDYQLKLSRLDASRDRLSFLIFGFQDQLLVSTPDGYAQGTDADTQGDLGTTYSTHRVGLSWLHPFTDTLRLLVTPSVGFDGVSLGLGDSFRVDQGQWLLELRTELAWAPTPAITITPGFDFIGGLYDFDAKLAFDPSGLGSYDPLAERQPWVTSGAGGGWGPDLYVDAELRPLRDRDRLLIVPGLRMDTVVITDSSRDEPMLTTFGLDPRLNARFRVTEGGTLKGGAGLYNQPPQPFEAWRPEGVVKLDMEKALSTELGWEQIIRPGLQADGSVFYKDLRDRIVQNPDFTDLSDPYFTNEGIGRAYGLEVIVRQAPVKHLFGWVSYTLSKSERNDFPDRVADERQVVATGQPGADTWYPFEFDQTHILVTVAGYELPRDWGVSAKVQYVTGNPYTPYAGGVYDVDQSFYFPYATDTYNSSRMPDFFALDARVDKLFAFKRWQLEVFLDLLNVARGTNPEFTLYNYDYTEQTWIRGLPFVPSPGFQAEFNF